MTDLSADMTGNHLKQKFPSVAQPPPMNSCFVSKETKSIGRVSAQVEIAAKQRTEAYLNKDRELDEEDLNVTLLRVICKKWLNMQGKIWL